MDEMAENKDELKPVRCGCGGEANVDLTLQHDGYYMAGVVCVNCGTKTIPFWHTEKDRAVDYAVTTWNRAMGNEQECAKCGYIAVSILSERHYTFCPNCGADMRGDR